MIHETSNKFEMGEEVEIVTAYINNGEPTRAVVRAIDTINMSENMYKLVPTPTLNQPQVPTIYQANERELRKVEPSK